LKKLDKMPIEVDKLLGSPRLKLMKDFQRWWYLALIFNAWVAPRPGWIADDGNLDRIVGAHSKPMWNQHSAVVLACFERREGDGKSWLYSQKVEALHRRCSDKYETKADNARKSVRKRSVPEVYVSISALPISHIYEAYPRKVKPLKAKESIQKAIKKKAESSGISELDASQLILLAVKEYAASPVGQSKFALHPTTWFNQGCYDDDRTEWYRDESNGKQKDESHDAIAEALRSMDSGEVGTSEKSISKPHLVTV
jgi:uncharacterized protein YdaU (DUF1376 family)